MDSSTFFCLRLLRPAYVTFLKTGCKYQNVITSGIYRTHYICEIINPDTFQSQITLPRHPVCNVFFLEEIKDTNKTFRNHLTFKRLVLLFATLFILTAFNFNYTAFVFYILTRLITRSPTSSCFTSKGSYNGQNKEDFI